MGTGEIKCRQSYLVHKLRSHCRIASCLPDSQPEIAEVLHEEALAQRLVAKEWDESIVSPTKLAQGVGKTVEINGVLHEITGPSESDVLAQETALYRAAMQPVATNH